MTNKHEKYTIKEAEIIEEDRLSSLPDDILVHILSIFPTKFAVASSVLSRRWRHLWTKSTSFLFRFNIFEEKDEISAANFITHVLTNITSPCIHKFTLHITPLSFLGITYLQSNGDENYFVTWLRQLFSRKIEQIHVEGIYEPPDDIHRVIYVKLPQYMFQTPWLIILELETTYSFELPPFKDEIHLPNLKRLRIGLSERCYEQFSKLISSCPSLEVLIFEVSVESPYYQHVSLEISSQSLKYLSLRLPWSTFNNKGNLHVNAPKLVNFYSNLDTMCWKPSSNFQLMRQ